MTQEEVRTFSYTYLNYNTPLSGDHAESMIHTVILPGTARILDLGCGWGELLLQFLEANPDATGIGIDKDDILITRAITNADNRGLSNRVQFITQDATQTTGVYEFVICIGATHIWKNRGQALQVLHDKVAPSGILLFGDGFWAEEPSDKLREDFGELHDLSTLQDDVRTSGFEILRTETATLSEWDEFESAWRRGLEQSGNSEAQAFAAERKIEYEDGYRGTLGFSYVVARKK